MTTTAPSTHAHARVDAGDRAVVRAAVLALARKEGKRLIRHPIFLAFLALTLFSMFAFVGEQRSLWDIDYLALMVFPVSAGALIAANLAMLRGRRHDAEELFATAPLSMRARTAGHLIAAMWPATLVLGFIVAWLAVLRIVFDATGLPPLAFMLIPPALVTGAGVIGVMLARWIPSSLVTVPALFLIGLIEGQILSIDPETNGLRWLAPWNEGILPDLMWPRPHLRHALYLIGLTGVLASIALLRDRPRKPLMPFTAAWILFALVAAIAQVQPPSEASLQRAATFVDHPETLRECKTAAAVRMCYFPRFRETAPRWMAWVHGVTNALPASVRARGMEVHQRIDPGARRQFPPILLHRLESLSIDPTGRRSDAIHIGIDMWDGHGSFAQLSLATAAAGWAVGLPTESARVETTPAELAELAGEGDPPPPAAPNQPLLLDVGCDAGGQARAVVALWLAAQATPGAGSYLRYGISIDADGEDPDDGVALSNGRDAPVTSSEDAMVSIAPSDDSTPAVVWRLSDVHYALQLLQRPAADVRARLHDQWERYTDPSTTTGELVRALDLRPSTLRPLEAKLREPRCI